MYTLPGWHCPPSPGQEHPTYNPLAGPGWLLVAQAHRPQAHRRPGCTGGGSTKVRVALCQLLPPIGHHWLQVVAEQAVPPLPAQHLIPPRPAQLWVLLAGWVADGGAQLAGHLRVEQEWGGWGGGWGGGGAHTRLVTARG